MGRKTGIDWTDHTWNPWQGCRKISPGCVNCYMYRDKKRFGQDPATVIRSKPATFNAPLKWQDPAKVFVCSWSDFFIEDADPWRDEAWEIMRRTPHLTYQILTKRPENILDRLPADWPFGNVWLGVTVESQAQLHRIEYLPVAEAVVKFVSIEPMIGPVDLTAAINAPVPWDEMMSAILALDWVIVGGETGPAARRMDPAWAARLKRQCKDAGVPFFMKQMTNKAPIPDFLQGREFPLQKKPCLTIFHCGPQNQCPDGAEHDWSAWESFENGGTTVCSKCGCRAIDNDMWR